MTQRERFIHALECKPFEKGEHVPHFELVFFLTMEVLTKVHPSHRQYSQWGQMSEKEKSLQRRDMAECYVGIAKKYDHDAIFAHPNPGTLEEVILQLEAIRDLSGDKYYTMIHGDSTFSMPDGSNMMDFSMRMVEDAQGLKDEAERELEKALEKAEKISRHKGLLDGFALCSDYCFNVNPFFSPAQFAEFVAPYLKRLVKGYKDMGFYVIKHTDGNIMPILDQMIDARPHAFHSIDPQAKVSLTKVHELAGDNICLIGNVNCGLLQTGSDDEVAADVRRALREGMSFPNGYIFSTSNCVYTGMDLQRYELMHRIWREEGRY